MIGARISLGEWLEAAVEGAKELMLGTLGFEVFEVARIRDSLPRGGCGAYITLMSDQGPLLMAVVSSREVCSTFARAFLSTGVDEGDLSGADVADAVGEMVNILAGRVKARMNERDASIRIGLPVFVHGKIQFTEHLEAAVADVSIDQATAEVLLLRHRGNSGDARW